MFVLDVNVLIYAFRRDSPYHTPCHRWLTHALATGSQVAVPSLVELALVRIVTLPALGPAAAPLSDAFAFLAALRQVPTYWRVEPDVRHQERFQRLCADLDLRGNDVNDAYLAAFALEADATLVSADRGFSRFPGLRHFDPLQSRD